MVHQRRRHAYRTVLHDLDRRAQPRRDARLVDGPDIGDVDVVDVEDRPVGAGGVAVPAAVVEIAGERVLQVRRHPRDAGRRVLRVVHLGRLAAGREDPGQDAAVAGSVHLDRRRRPAGDVRVGRGIDRGPVGQVVAVHVREEQGTHVAQRGVRRTAARQVAHAEPLERAETEIDDVDPVLERDGGRRAGSGRSPRHRAARRPQQDEPGAALAAGRGGLASRGRRGGRPRREGTGRGETGGHRHGGRRTEKSSFTRPGPRAVRL